MAQLQKSVVTLRIMGDDIIPDEITKLLGASPTHAQTKGDKIVGKNTGYVRIARSGMWRLCASDRKPENMDGQIQEIFSQLTGDLAVWQGITKRFRVDLFCGLFMGCSNDGLTLSPESLTTLGERGIKMGLDIYAGDDDEQEAST
jgi:hypothetical protein